MAALATMLARPDTREETLGSPQISRSRMTRNFGFRIGGQVRSGWRCMLASLCKAHSGDGNAPTNMKGVALANPFVFAEGDARGRDQRCDFKPRWPAWVRSVNGDRVRPCSHSMRSPLPAPPPPRVAQPCTYKRLSHVFFGHIKINLPVAKHDGLLLGKFIREHPLAKARQGVGVPRYVQNKVVVKFAVEEHGSDRRQDCGCHGVGSVLSKDEARKRHLTTALPRRYTHAHRSCVAVIGTTPKRMRRLHQTTNKNSFALHSARQKASQHGSLEEFVPANPGLS